MLNCFEYLSPRFVIFSSRGPLLGLRGRWPGRRGQRQRGPGMRYLTEKRLRRSRLLTLLLLTPLLVLLMKMLLLILTMTLTLFFRPRGNKRRSKPWPEKQRRPKNKGDCCAHVNIQTWRLLMVMSNDSYYCYTH